ncbi:helix-turn-helix transcriptional regulator [Nocardia sp. NPDC046473]|uniref:helix-turn-helix domain-containing protein n=1 Tax=Nocardia sp. NPDC046473 TaxID=3155733 RepID=UPI0033F9DC60
MAAELRGLRDLAGISGRDLAKRIGVSQSKISRIESGNAVPSLPEVQAWGRELGTPAEVQQRLATMTAAAHHESSPWRTALLGKGHLQHDILRKESDAHQLRVFQSSVVPGLLQTPEYARRVFSMFQIPYSETDLAAAVSARLDRQLALYSRDKRFDFLITESALRWRPGPPSLLVVQLERIAQLSTLQNVDIGLIPQNTEALTFTSHSFVVYDGSDVSQASVETIHSQMNIVAAEDVELYNQRWIQLRRMALFDDHARDFLHQLIADINSTTY